MECTIESPFETTGTNTSGFKRKHDMIQEKEAATFCDDQNEQITELVKWLHEKNVLELGRSVLIEDLKKWAQKSMVAQNRDSLLDVASMYALNPPYTRQLLSRIIATVVVQLHSDGNVTIPEITATTSKASNKQNKKPRAVS